MALPQDVSVWTYANNDVPNILFCPYNVYRLKHIHTITKKAHSSRVSKNIKVDAAGRL